MKLEEIGRDLGRYSTRFDRRARSGGAMVSVEIQYKSLFTKDNVEAESASRIPTRTRISRESASRDGGCAVHAPRELECKHGRLDSWSSLGVQAI